jgi:hypothetical protein
MAASSLRYMTDSSKKCPLRGRLTERRPTTMTCLPDARGAR